MPDANTQPIPGTLAALSAAEERSLDDNGVPVKLGRQYRRTHVATEGYNADEHTVELSLTSEEPVERYFGTEILSHKKGAIRTTRLKNGISLLFNHDYDALLGRSISYKTPDGGPLTLVYRFGPSNLAQEKEAEVAAEVLKDTSGGYQVYEWEITEDKNGVRTYMAVDWEPLEGSLVTVPADPTVGAGRSKSSIPVKYTLRKLGDNDKVVSERHFAFDPETSATRSLDSDDELEDDDETDEEDGERTAPTPTTPPSPEAPTETSTTTLETKRTITMAEDLIPVVDHAAEREARLTGLRSLNKEYPEQFNERSLKAAEALDVPVADIKKRIADQIIDDSQGADVRTIGEEVFDDMGEREASQHSLRNAYAAAINGQRAGSFTDKGATGLVVEVSTALRKKAEERGVTGLGAGILIPSFGSRTRRQIEQSLQRTPIASGGNAGTASNFTNVVVDPIEMLRSRVAIFALGATRLAGLHGKLQMPRQTSAGSCNWLTEGSANTTANPAFDDIVMSPNRLSMGNDYYRDFFAQSALAIDSLLALDRFAVLQRALDTAGIAGSGTAPVPLGLLNRSGLAAVLAGTTRASNGTVTAGAGGVPLTYVDYNNLESAISTQNGDIGTLGLLTTNKLRAAGRSTPKIPGTASEFIFPDSAVGQDGLQTGPLGYRTLSTSANYLTGFTANSVSNLHACILGVWDQMMVGDWGLSELIVDNVTGAASAKVTITEHGFYDINVRHIEAFAACTSALPS